jgi:predicted metalloprotease
VEIGLSQNDPVPTTAGSRPRTPVRQVTVLLVTLAGLLVTGCARPLPGLPGSESGGARTADTSATSPDGSGSASPDGTAQPAGPDERPDHASSGAGNPAAPGDGPGNAPPDTAPVPPATVTGGGGTRSDQVAAAVVTGVEQYWRERFPTLFGRRWINISAFRAVDPADAKEPAPCLHRPADLTDQAMYCPTMNLVAWDRAGLLPRLRDGYGDGAVLVALAHEIGHAVQDRLDIDGGTRAREPARYPPILLEGMADCFAGVVVHAAVDGQVPRVTLDRRGLDQTLRALLSLRDPVGLTVSSTAHGDAFDRASAFLDGYQNGAVRCAGMTAPNQLFTERGYTSLSELVRGGDLGLPELLRGLGPDANTWFGDLVSSRGRSWRPVLPLLGTQAGCGPADLAGQGPVRYCPASGAISAFAADLEQVHRLGDYASAEVLASRYALAALAALGRPVQGAAVGRSTVCLTGAYTRALLDRTGGKGFALSPGDIDEAVQELLEHDFAARDVVGRSPAGDLGLERIGQFRAGMLGGPTGCGI